MTKFYFHTAYGLSIKSEILLPELPSISAINETDVKISLGKVSLPADEIFRGTSKDVQGILQRFLDDIGILYSECNHKSTEATLYRILDGIGKFILCNGKEIVIDPAINVDYRLLRRYLLGDIFAVFLTQRNYLVLHASSVNINGSAVAFSGLSGAGKSTIAFEFYKHGYPIIADDYITLNFNYDDLPMINPAFPSLKLSRSSIMHNKISTTDVMDWDSNFKNFYVETSYDFPENESPLKNIYWLEEGYPMRIEKIDVQNAFNELLSCTFGASLFSSEEKQKNLLNYSRIIKHVSLRKLIIPRSLNYLSNVVKKIEEDVKFI